MKKVQTSEQLKRALTVIKADRLGVSAGVESVVSGEVKSVLNDYFCLNGDVKTVVELNNGTFKITVTATACSIKNVKVVE